MKQRFSSLDIKVIAHELSKSLLSLRVSNIYDLSSRIFLFKFAKPNHREQFIVDTGFRCHLTSFARTTAGAPSAFVGRLRKFLKTRRVTAVAQVGTDRILEIQFSDGQYRLFLEFYASGNIILTDHELKVIAIFRNVTEGAPHEQVQLGTVYNLSERQNVNGVPTLSSDRVKSGLQRFQDGHQENILQQNQSKKAAKKSNDMLRKALASCITEFPPMLLEHALHVTGFDPKITPEEILKDEMQISRLVESLNEAAKLIDNIMRTDVVKGYIIGRLRDTPAKSPAGGPSEKLSLDSQPTADVIYNDFHPFTPEQFQNNPEIAILEFEGYNQTVDEFFSSIEGQKLESRLREKEETAKRKIETAKQAQESRIEGLQAVQEVNVRKAQAIETNLERVEEATAAINGLIAQGMDWIEIDRLIELEQAMHNPVAEIIKLPLKLHENTATLLLADWSYEADEDENDLTESEPSESEDEKDAKPTASRKVQASNPAKIEDKRLAIDIDLALSAWSNAREYYDQKKTAAAKEEKTLQASSKALKSAQHKIDADLKKALKQEKQVLRPVRQQLWFEKFIYFISSDGYLVLGGKDGQQADLLYKHHLSKGDVYVHADLNGAASVIIKNNPSTSDAPIPPSTLSQAGNLSVATSSAWDSKAVMAAWWVKADQVSKSSPTGDYLGPGNFFIKEEKQFLPPAQLILGFAVMFQISEASKANHKKHRIYAADTVVDSDRTTKVDSQSNSTAAEESFENHEDEAYVSGGDDEMYSISASERDEGGSEIVEEYANPLQSHSGSVGDELKKGISEESEPDSNHSAPNDTNLAVAKTLVPVPESYPLASDAVQDSQIPFRDGHRGTGSGDKSPADDDEDGGNADTDLEPLSEQHPPKPAQPQPVKQNTVTRGKRGKRKKMQQKYADQDDEDREAAMRLLGSRAGQEKSEEEARVKRIREEEAAAQKQRRRAQHEKKQAEGRALEERRRLQQEDGENGNEEDEADDSGVADLEALVGTPLPGDEILEAIPVCAPWTALGRYKYKVKLQPGPLKKGKAVREILGKWSADEKDKKKVDERSEDPERIWPREMELVRAWREAEILNILPVGKVRVMMSGAASSGKFGKGPQNKSKSGSGKGSKKQR